MKRMACALAALTFALACGQPGEGGGPPPPETTALRAGATPLPRKRPNVLLIVTDDQRARGWEDVMPATRRLFQRQGRNFPNFYASTPMCCPSRASIFTGRYVHNHGVLTNFDAQRMDPATTVQYYLKTNGYLTGIAGKYLNKWPIHVDPAYFDRWAIMRVGYLNTRFNVEGRLRRIQRYSTTYLGDKTREYIDWFEKRDKRPWFMYLATAAPHAPYTPQRKYADAPVTIPPATPAQQEEDISDKPPFMQEGEDKPGRATLLAERQLRTLMSVDDEIAKTFRKLERLDEDRRTLAIFVSDNGYLWGEHRRTGKRLPYTPAIEIPHMMRWPGVIEGGVEDERLGAIVDIVPTIMEAGRAEPDIPMDGYSLFGDHSRDRILLEYFREPKRDRVPDWIGRLTPDYQFMEYYTESDIIREYYDLNEDPWQLENLFGNVSPLDDPDVDQITEEMRADARCEGSSCP